MQAEKLTEQVTFINLNDQGQFYKLNHSKCFLRGRTQKQAGTGSLLKRKYLFIKHTFIKQKATLQANIVANYKEFPQEVITRSENPNMWQRATPTQN